MPKREETIETLTLRIEDLEAKVEALLSYLKDKQRYDFWQNDADFLQKRLYPIPQRRLEDFTDKKE